MSFDPELFPDVADALGIDSPAIVEKDAYAVELLRLLTQVQSEQFGRQHPLFLANPVAELHHGLNGLCTNPVHKERYERFIGPLVYHESPAS